MLNIREGEILKSEYYPSMGTIATIRFVDNLPPMIGDIFKYQEAYFRVCGVIVSGSSEPIKNGWEQGVYDCRIEKIEGN